MSSVGDRLIRRRLRDLDRLYIKTLRRLSDPLDKAILRAEYEVTKQILLTPPYCEASTPR